jgi:hypothetical protein
MYRPDAHRNFTRRETMSNADHVVASWLEGSDNANGLDNPAGPLFFGGLSAIEAAVDDMKENMISSAKLCSSIDPRCDNCA